MTEPVTESGSMQRAGADAVLDADLAALVARMAAHDEGALERLFELTVGKTYAVALRILRSAETAEEVVEDTYWQAWREASSYDRARGRVLPWLLMICRSRALDATRRRDPAEAVENIESLQDELSAEKADPFDLVEAMQRGSAIRAAIETLKPRARQLVAFAFFRGLSHQEIAEICDMPLGTVKTTLYRACQQLKDGLAGQGWEPKHE